MEWKEVRLGDVCEIKGGKRLPKGVNLITQRNSHPYIRVRDLGKSKTIELNSSYEYVDEITQKQIQRYITQKGDILISIVGTIGLIAIVGDSLNGANLTENCVKLVKLDNIDSEYLYYYLKSPFGQQNISRGTVGAVQAKLPIKNIQEFSINCPKLVSDQRRIASILSSLDRKIELNNKINADLEEMAQAIFKNWFVDFEPFKDDKFVDSELGMIPEGWKVGTLDEIFSLKYGKNLSTSMILEKGDYPVYGANGIIGYHNEYNCDKYSVLVTSRGNGSGDVSRTHHPKSFITNNSFVVEPLEQYKYIELPFINGLFNIIDFKSYCSGSAQPQLTNKAMRNICIISPPMEIVIKYCEMLETLFSHIECVIAENSRLSLLRDTLLPRLMSGELEVPE